MEDQDIFISLNAEECSDCSVCSQEVVGMRKTNARTSDISLETLHRSLLVNRPGRDCFYEVGLFILGRVTSSQY